MSDDTPVTDVDAVEKRANDEAAMIDALYSKGFSVDVKTNGGFTLRVYAKTQYEAAFTNFPDMIRWLADALGEEMPNA
jgi:hypothetical protein